MARSILIRAIFIAVVSVGFASAASAQVLEVIEATNADNLFSGGGGNHGQSFLVNQTGYISCVSFQADDSSDDLTGNVTVYNGETIPGGLAYTEPEEVTWPGDALYNFNLTTPFPVTGGQTYSVLSGIEYVRGDTNDTYPGGSLMNSSGTVSFWESAFRITITANGEPCDNLIPLMTDLPVPALSRIGLGTLFVILLALGMAIVRRRNELV